LSDQQPKRTFLGMPGYGKQTAAAGRGLWRARASMENVAVEYRQGSLLAANFNALWCSALNACHRGERVDYFAMLHDDIGPEDFWLDKLIDELEANDLDVLGVAVPIKDTKGLTSLAIDGDDTWRPKCRLTTSEVAALPETFKSDDLGGPLLLNTGCWVCRFDPEWARQVRFTINDRIVFNKAADRYEAQVEPEDWYFSRLCHELGLKIGATRKIEITHRGEMDFSNQKAWGDIVDRAYTSKSHVNTPFPYDVRGWLTPVEGTALAKLATGKRVLEIGSYCGRSTICMARTAESVVAVDFFDGRATPNPGETSGEFFANLERYGVAEKVSTAHPDDAIAGQFDLVFIDGNHEHDFVVADIAKAMAVLSPGGLLAFHDYRTSPGECDGGWDEGVTAAVNQLLVDGGELISRHDTVAVVRPPVLVPN
jgi:hypothetical protein